MVTLLIIKGEFDMVLGIRAPEELKQKITVEAKRQGLTVNALVVSILWAWLKQNEKN